MRLPGLVAGRTRAGAGGSWRPPPCRGLSAGSLREPPRRIFWAMAAPCMGTAQTGWRGAKRRAGAKDAPGSGRGAPARSAPLRHPTGGPAASGSAARTSSQGERWGTRTAGERQNVGRQRQAEVQRGPQVGASGGRAWGHVGEFFGRKARSVQGPESGAVWGLGRRGTLDVVGQIRQDLLLTCRGIPVAGH